MSEPVTQGTSRFALIYEGFLGLLALVILYTLTIPVEPWTRWANFIIWLIFVIDYLVRLATARRRDEFARANVLDLIAILPIDFLPAARLSQTVRLFRLVRVASALWRSGRRLRGLLRTNGLGNVLAVAALLIVVGGIAVWLVEPAIATPGDGIWWGIVTATTVGYGDISPATTAGRLVASVLMLTGIGTLGMITASLATYFIGRRQPADPHLAGLQGQLARWEELSLPEKRRALAVLAALVESDADGGDGR